MDAQINAVPCPNGHIAPRRAVDNGCKACAREAGKRWRAKNPQRVSAYNKQYQREYRLRNGEKLRAKKREYAKANSEAAVARAARWAKENPERRREAVRLYHMRHPGNRIANIALRKARKLKQTCECCSKEEFKGIYLQANAGGFEVDHIIPLAVGGPHCLKNLQLLTPAEHMHKTCLDRGLIVRARGSWRKNANE